MGTLSAMLEEKSNKSRDRRVKGPRNKNYIGSHSHFVELLLRLFAKHMRYLYLMTSFNGKTFTNLQMSGNITLGFHTYRSQAAGAGSVKNQLSPRGRLTAGNTASSRANWILPTTTGTGLKSGTGWFNRQGRLLHYLLSNGTYSRRKLFLQLC